MDISTDGSAVYVGTGTGNLYVVDPSSLHVLQVLNTADVVPGGFATVSPFALNDGRLFVMAYGGVDGAGNAVLWSVAQGTATVVTLPIRGGGITRSGDRSSILIASPVSDGAIAVFGAATGQFTVGQYPGTYVARVAANPAKDQFAVSDLNGNVAIINSHLDALGSIHIEPPGQTGGQRLNGMVFSADGARLHLSVDSTIQEYDTVHFQQQGVVASPYSLGTFTEPLFFDEDSSDLILGINEEGLDFIDVSSIATNGLKSVPYAYAYGLGYLSPDTGALAGGTAVTGSIAASSSTTPSSVAAVYLGTSPVLGLNASGTGIPFQSPPASIPGPVNMTTILSDGTPLVGPLAFTYGPSVERAVTNSSPADGGGSGFITGYGFGDTTSGLQISIGGQPATVTQINLQLPGLDNPIPTPIVGATLTVPKGTPGAADIVVSTSSGSTTLRGAFLYTSASTLHSATTQLQSGVYDPQRKAIYFAATNQILTWSVSSSQWLSPISVPAQATAQLIGVSLSPNGKTLAVSDQGNGTILVLDPSSPQSLQSFGVRQGLIPASVAASDQGTVYFNAAAPFINGHGTLCMNDLFWRLDISAGTITDLTKNKNWCMDPFNRVLISPDGTTVYLDADGQLKILDFATDTWFEAAELNGSSDMAISADGSRLIQMFNVIDLTTGNDVGSPAWSDLDLSDNQEFSLGEKMDATGTLVFQPRTNALDIADLGHLEQKRRVSLPYPVADVFDPLVWDGDNDTGYVIVQGGLLEVPLTPLPLVLRSSSPGAGNAGTTVTLTGSGFYSGLTATVDGVPVPLTITDERTASLVMPAHANGPVVVSLSTSDGQTAFLDPGFTYGGTVAAGVSRSANHPWRLTGGQASLRGHLKGCRGASVPCG